ncbi:MAG: TetR/AcrR family transcriptional regulator [Elusimicrobia bacterium]|nr:TetR/AcrR family transcriptional regulator [Elusimicrobiota bacterium]
MRERIIKTAIGLFARRGIDRVSIREIVAELKVTKPVLYYYFKNKEDLCREMFLRYALEAAQVRQDAGEAKGAPLEDLLTAVLDGHLRFFKARPEVARFALQALICPGSAGIRRVVEEFEARHQRQLVAMLHQWEKAGVIRRGAAGDVLRMVSAVLTHFVMCMHLGRGAGLDAGLPRRLARLVCAGAADA